jgi:hypothetical protein
MLRIGHLIRKAGSKLSSKDSFKKEVLNSISNYTRRHIK